MSVVAELNLDGITPTQQAQLTARLLRHDFDQWAVEAARVRHCHRPVRLVGRAHTIEKATGAVRSTFDSTDLADGVLYVKCGNRRASACPPCSREYGADMWHLLRAGAAGGDKGVPPSVATHPMVFATLTAPSFGPVHARKKPSTKGPRRCRPRARGESCPHGRSLSCMALHSEGDSALGQPLCVDCYDYDAHLVWQWWAPELWRRFTITLPRVLAQALGVSQRAARNLARVSFAKVGEYQARGVIHFHAIIRLDGPPDDEQPFPAPVVDVDSTWLAGLVTAAAGRVRYQAPPVAVDGPSWNVGFGAQVDARPIHARAGREDLTGPIHPESVASYIAKYSTKSAGDLDPGDRPANAHLARLRRRVWELDAIAGDAYPPGLAQDNPYRLLGKWTHMLGFRGHFASKSRCYSTTLTRIRTARRRYQQAKTAPPNGAVDVAGLDPDCAGEETTLVVGSWRFAGTGWLTEGDAALAMAAAARAREHAQHRAQMKRVHRQ